MKLISFTEWLAKREEMTSASAAGGGTFTDSIARFQRPMGMVRRCGKKKKKN